MMDKSKLIKRRSEGTFGSKFKSSIMFKVFIAGALSQTVGASSLEVSKGELQPNNSKHDRNVLLALRDILDQDDEASAKDASKGSSLPLKIYDEDEVDDDAALPGMLRSSFA